LWPNDTDPSWLITCNEQEAAEPGMVRINLATGAQEVILTGTLDCDPVRRTPWGSILFGEEAGGGPAGGRLYELIDPLHTTGVSLDRATGTFSGGSGAANLTARPALGRLSFEGLAIYPSGVTYFGDEYRPAQGVGGGAYFKFIPATLRDPGAGAITTLADSPYAASYAASGSLYGLRLGLRAGTADYGQGTEYGLGAWVPIPAAADPDLRAAAAALHLTGYYRPEDADIDRAAEAKGLVRFCANNTGNEPEDQLWGEAICISDGTLTQAGSNTGVPEVRLLVPGSPALAMPDNIAWQPHRGNWIIHEDAETVTALQGPHNDDLWDCLPDGMDPDLQSDGCIRIATLNDLTAEWTGGIFDADGRHFYVSVPAQHLRQRRDPGRHRLELASLAAADTHRPGPPPARAVACDDLPPGQLDTGSRPWPTRVRACRTSSNAGGPGRSPTPGRSGAGGTGSRGHQAGSRTASRAAVLA
jgi:hypothetical protein